MKYLGGKSRIAKQLCAALPDADRVWEPFCGGLNMTLELAKRYPAVIATDLHPGPIALGLGLQVGWAPPTEVSEAEHKAARSLPDTDPLKAFVGFGCSFSGTYFGGFAPKEVRSIDRSRSGGKSGVTCNDPPKAARAFCDRITPHLGRVAFGHMSFFEEAPLSGFLIYCDPPYNGTAGYTTGSFDSSAFWSRCTEHAQAGSRVFVSEYADPPVLARLVWSHTGRKCMQGRGGQASRTEKLFEVLAD